MIGNTADATSATEVKALHTLETETAAAGVKDEVPTTIEHSTTAIKEKEMKKELSEMAGGKEIAAEKLASKIVDVGKADDGDFDYYDAIRPVIEPSLYDSGLSSASQERDLNSTGIGNRHQFCTTETQFLS